MAIIDEIITKLTELPSIESNTSLDSFRDEGDGRGRNQHDIALIIKESVIYNQSRDILSTKIRDDFLECQNYVNKNYSSCTEIEQARNTFKWEAWKEQDNTLEEIESKMNKYKKYRTTKDRDIRDSS